MEQPEGLQLELLKLSRPVRKWVLELAGMVDPEESRTGCDCCDPTSPSPDPVVVRLEGEVAELQKQLADAQCQLVASHPEAWANITKRLTDERDTLRGLLREACIGYEHNYDDASSDKRLRRVPIFHAWYERAQAALEGKQ